MEINSWKNSWKIKREKSELIRDNVQAIQRERKAQKKNR